MEGQDQRLLHNLLHNSHEQEGRAKVENRIVPEDYKLNCGADIVVRNVVPYLLPALRCPNEDEDDDNGGEDEDSRGEGEDEDSNDFDESDAGEEDA